MIYVAKPLTKERLEEIYKELKENELDPRYCDTCGQMVYTNVMPGYPVTCWDCMESRANED